MKILITGANGYLGQGIVKAIIETGNEVIATDFKLDKVDERAIKKECDLFTIKNSYSYFEKPDILLHLAWQDGFVHYSETHMGELHKHIKFISEFAKSDVKMISVMGSMHEVGFYEGSIDELTPCHPESFYGVAKNALRDVTKILCKQNKKIFQWLRGYYIVGNAKYGSSIFSKIVAAEEAGKAEFPFTQGLNQFDFIDYNEFCTQVACAVIQTEVIGIINICSGHPEKLSERVERFIKENGYNIKLLYGAFPDRPYDSKAVWGNDSKIKQICGY